MSLLAGASVWTNTNSNAKPIMKRQATIGRTAKPKEPDPPDDETDTEHEEISPSARVNSLLEAMTQNDGSGLADFEPIKHPEINVLKNSETQPSIQFAANDVHLAKHTNYAQTYTAPRIYQGRPQTQSPFDNDKIMEKINYMIHLLEEQQHEKTANISEEFVLYTLLGVFVIFTVDSFTRAGRYVR
jgi:hypothetical protein